ncbi:MAG: hypothetical protein WCD76_02660 [Pyrinomonadaceae bacterium]
MSEKVRCHLAGMCCHAALIFFAAVVTQAQTFDARLAVSSVTPGRVRVVGARHPATTAWSFRNAYAGAVNLGERIEKLTLADESGTDVPVRKLASGEFEAERAATHFSYDVKLDPPSFLTDAAHVSWLTIERGLLLPGDLLPLPLGDARLTFELPANWVVSSVAPVETGGGFKVKEAEQSVFVIGQNLRERRERAGASEVLYVTSGAWAFDDDEVTRSIAGTLRDYEKLFGGVSRPRVLVTLLPFPGAAPANAWSAETRGGSVVLLSGRAPSKIAATALVNSSLTHELFHLWVPNGLSLEGDYDWFYEGFTNYQALREGMRHEELTFQDYLNALGRAFDGYKAARGPREVSLPEASARRWSGNPALVYHKGMLVAFLYDLTLQRGTNGKKSLDDAYRELFRRYGVVENRVDANRAVVETLSGMPGMSALTASYVREANAIDLAAAIEPFGLRVEPGGVLTHVSVAASLERGQRDLLRKLGYNEQAEADARKLHEKLKRRQPQP